mgnify:CR=1 FL=1
MPAKTYTAAEIVARLSHLARDLVQRGVLAHADAAKAVAQVRRLGLGYAPSPPAPPPRPTPRSATP